MAPGRRFRPPFAHAVAVAVAALVGATAGLSGSHTVHADATFDQVLYSLINQDRANAGLPPLRWNPTLGTIGEQGTYGGCGFAISGRSEDMIQRNYFSHTICGTQNVFNVMQAYGVGYQSAGENIGWESGYTDPTQAAEYLNTAFMNSTEHRANILNPNYTDVGTGSWATAPGQVWTGGGGSFSNVFMASEEFAQLPTSTGTVNWGTPAPPPSSTAHGYWMVASDGGIFTFGVPGYGSTGAQRLNQPIVGMARTRDGGGYWLVASDGGIFPFGDALQHSYGSTGNVRLNQPIVGMAATASGNGYWLVARDGGIFPFGDARLHSYGSTGNIRLNQPIVGMVRTASGNGYWLVAADGGIFPFGDARLHSYGSTGGIRLNQPIVGMARTASGNGYWLVARDGGIFPFGDARWHSYGSTGNIRLAKPIVAMASTADGNGYWLIASDGGVFPFGDAASKGSLGSTRLNQPIDGMASWG
jgi:uncharacterized protein YkwD